MSQDYNRVRCVVCGVPWDEHTDLTLVCARYRPFVTPPWVAAAVARHEVAATASNLPRSTDDATTARREFAGGTPTREWPPS